MTWSLDFVADQLSRGERFRALPVVDVFTREGDFRPQPPVRPRRAEVLTETLKRALDLVDVKVFDHFVVGRGATMSFAERGML